MAETEVFESDESSPLQDELVIDKEASDDEQPMNKRQPAALTNTKQKARRAKLRERQESKIQNDQKILPRLLKMSET